MLFLNCRWAFLSCQTLPQNTTQRPNFCYKCSANSLGLILASSYTLPHFYSPMCCPADRLPHVHSPHPAGLYLCVLWLCPALQLSLCTEILPSHRPISIRDWFWKQHVFTVCRRIIPQHLTIEPCLIFAEVLIASCDKGSASSGYFSLRDTHHDTIDWHRGQLVPLNLSTCL